MNRKIFHGFSLLIVSCCLIVNFILPINAKSNSELGYVEINVNGISNKYISVKKDNEVYISLQDLSSITGYSLEVDDNSISFIKSTFNDNVTPVVIDSDGTALAMGREYKLDILKKDEMTFLPLNKMLYLLHTQFWSENGTVVVLPLYDTIVDFLGGENYYSMWKNKVNHTDLLIDGENEGLYYLTSSLAAIFNDFDPMIFVPWWPKEGFVPALNKQYEEALLQLAVDDKDFLDSYGQEEIAEKMNVLDVGGVNNILGDTNFFVENIGKGVEKLEEAIDSNKSIKANPYSDLSGVSSEEIKQISSHLSATIDATTILDMVLKTLEVRYRSLRWGEDYLNQLSVLTDFDDLGYNRVVTDNIKTVAKKLIEENENPIEATANKIASQSTAYFLSKIMEKSPFGVYLSVLNVGIDLAKINPDFKNTIEAKDLSYMVDCLIKTEHLAMNEMSQEKSKLLGNIVNAKSTEECIARLRNSTMLSLRCNLRNNAFIYYLNTMVNKDESWEDSEQAKTIRERIINDYVYIFQVMQTERYDELLILDDFDNMYSDECGKVRIKITSDVFHEGEIPEYKVIKEDIPNLDQSPIDSDEKDGFIVRINGKYGFLNTEGTLELNADSDYLTMFDLDKERLPYSNFKACFSIGSSTHSGTRISGENCMLDGFGGAGIPASFDDGGNLFWYDFVREEKIELPDGNYRLTKLVGNTLDEDCYYIKVEGNDKIFGPYPIEEKAYFSGGRFSENNLEIYNNRVNASEISEMFYEHVEDGYKIWNADGTKYYDEIFDKATPISNNAMKVEKDGKMGVVDKNMELVLFGEFEDVSNVVNGRALVKIDGKWKLIEMENSSSNENTDEILFEYHYEYSEGEFLSDLSFSNIDGKKQALLSFWFNYGNSPSVEDFSFEWQDDKLEYEVVGNRSGKNFQLIFTPTNKGLNIEVVCKDGNYYTWKTGEEGKILSNEFYEAVRINEFYEQKVD